MVIILKRSGYSFLIQLFFKKDTGPRRINTGISDQLSINIFISFIYVVALAPFRGLLQQGFPFPVKKGVRLAQSVYDFVIKGCDRILRCHGNVNQTLVIIALNTVINVEIMALNPFFRVKEIDVCFRKTELFKSFFDVLGNYIGILLSRLEGAFKIKPVFLIGKQAECSRHFFLVLPPVVNRIFIVGHFNRSIGLQVSLDLCKLLNFTFKFGLFLEFSADIAFENLYFPVKALDHIPGFITALIKAIDAVSQGCNCSARGKIIITSPFFSFPA